MEKLLKDILDELIKLNAQVAVGKPITSASSSPTLAPEQLAGQWTHPDWSVFFDGFHFLEVRWPNGGQAYGAWFIDGGRVILSYVYKGEARRNTFIIEVLESGEQSLKIRDISNNKVEVLERVKDGEWG